MRTEKAIREYLEASQKVAAWVCHCKTPEGRAACAAIKEDHLMVIRLLQWVLGDNDLIGSLVERVTADAARGQAEFFNRRKT